MWNLCVFCVGIFITPIVSKGIFDRIEYNMECLYDDLYEELNLNGLDLFQPESGTGPDVLQALIHLSASAGGEFLPVIPTIATLIEDLIEDDDAKIRSIIQEEIVANNLVRFHSALESIKLNLKYLTMPALRNDDKVSHINTIRNSIQEIILELNKKKSISRAYAYRMVRVLSGLAVVVPVHAKLEASEIGTQNDFYLPCEALNTLNIYQGLAIFHFEERLRPMCVRREVCCNGLFNQLETRYKDYFANLTNMVGGSCFKHADSEFGTWTINAFEVNLINNPNCDSGSLCDFYIKVFLNDQPIHTTEPIGDITFNANYLVEYETDSIQKSSNVRIELWDDDDFFNGGDDLYATWHKTIPELLNKPKMTFQEYIPGRLRKSESMSEVTVIVHSCWKPQFKRN